MEVLSSARAAKRLGVNIQKFHRLTARYGIVPTFEGDGVRSAKFWSVDSVDQLVAAMRQELADEMARLDAARNVS